MLDLRGSRTDTEYTVKSFLIKKKLLVCYDITSIARTGAKFTGVFVVLVEIFLL